jgi:hypothetical protein
MNLDHTLKSHFLNLYSLALADTQIDTTELETLYELGQQRGVLKEEIDQLILNPENVKPFIPQDTLTKVECLYDFVKIILADGIVDDREKEMLEKFCFQFGFEEQNIPIIMEFLIEEGKKGTDRATIIEQVKQTL